jgi:copper chaperone
MMELQVGGMSCGHCAATVTSIVKEILPGAEVRVDLAAGKVHVVTSNAADDAKRLEIARAITDAGYEVASA